MNKVDMKNYDYYIIDGKLIEIKKSYNKLTRSLLIARGLIEENNDVQSLDLNDENYMLHHKNLFKDAFAVYIENDFGDLIFIEDLFLEFKVEKETKDIKEIKMGFKPVSINEIPGIFNGFEEFQLMGFKHGSFIKKVKGKEFGKLLEDENLNEYSTKVLNYFISEFNLDIYIHRQILPSKFQDITNLKDFVNKYKPVSDKEVMNFQVEKTFK